MPRERFAPDDPREWLNRARSNPERARADARLPGVYLEDLCFDAQQAAEKAIKALLIDRQVEFPYVHDLRRLLDLLEESGEPVPEEMRQVQELTKYATVGRYPGVGEPVSEDDYEQAVAIAATIVDWVSRRL